MDKKHPYEKIIREIFRDKAKIVGIDSYFLENVDMDDYDTEEINGIKSQKKIQKKFMDKEYDCLLYNSNQVAWSFFEDISFNIIILETIKNIEQMDSIIKMVKNHKYKKIRNIYVNKKFIEG